MRLLLDSHVLVWWLSDDRRLSEGARDLIAKNRAWLSLASYWELGVKMASGRMPRIDVPTELERNGFELLSITLAHADEAANLPYLHSDPFDRMLVAQARLEDMVLVTADAWIRTYDVASLRA